MFRSIGAGDLNRRVSIETYAVTRDSVGAETKTASILATVWADIEPLYGYEGKVDERVSAEVAYRITIRYRPAVTAKMRVVYGERRFDITTVRHDEARRQWTWLDCKEHA